MIPAVHPRGTNVGGLLRYLFGPGKREEHTDPHLVAAWTGAGDHADLQPPATPDGRHDIRRLAELLEQPVAVGRKTPAKPVWHCSIRTHPSDRLLSDGQWAHIAGEVMAAVGLAPRGDVRAVRWVAVRHADDHIHLVATMVRQDRRTAWISYDYRKAQAACRALEERYGLIRLAPPGAGSRSWPSPAELNKTARLNPGQRQVAPRDELRRQVRAAATAAEDEAGFFARLAAAGVLVRLRYSSRVPGQVTGYAVGLPRHTTAAGQVVWYSGGRLAADLTLPRLRAHWPGPPEPAGPPTAAHIASLGFAAPSDVYWRAVEVAAHAADLIRVTRDPAVARAAADFLAATARVWEGGHGGPLTAAADLFDRAAYEPRIRPVVQPTSVAGHLRAMARLIALTGAPDRDDNTVNMLRLMATIAAIGENLAAIREWQQRRHQADAARAAIVLLRAWQPPARSRPAAAVVESAGRYVPQAPPVASVNPVWHR